jgi:uncharacterized 2Fe-2S/4Fe-4S cluster protein (DUF4445 family)
MSDEALVVFTPSGQRGRFAHGTSLLDAARRLGVDIDSVCGGRAICGRCQCEPQVGSFAKHGIESRPDNLTPFNETEQRYRERKGLGEGRRLACQTRILGDLVVDVPADAQVHRQVVRKRAEAREIRLDPVVRLHYVEVEEPDMHKQRGDFERLREALQREWGLGELTIDLRSLQKLQKVLRAGSWTITVAVHDARRIIAIWPGFRDRAYGLAFDIGSTTIAAHLCDLGSGEVLASAGMMNPQIRMGEDLMSRVSYIMMNPGGDAQLTRAVREAVTALVGQVMADAKVAPDEILEAVFVGNPIMHHLLLGIDPTELGGAPFALATDSSITLWASEIGVDVIHPDARIYVLPCIAGHVGADCAGVVLSEGPHLQDEMMLVVDVGTNAEIVLGNRHRLLACSSPTGPAFEGAQISAGQRAAPGAIERVRIDRDTLEPRFKVIGCDLWSDEPNFDRVVARTGVTGICGSGIVEVLAELYLAGIILSDGTIDGAMAARTPRVVPEGRTFAYLLHTDARREIRITQNDVRAIQLAKAALYAGARLLMDRLEVDHVDRVVLAGAFGSHIDPLYAMVLGLIPDCDLKKVSAAGNAAGTGARIALLNKAARVEIEAVVQRIEKVETAIEARFQEHFVAAMGLPHTTAPTPNLAQAVSLPQRRVAEAEASGGRRRRRG